MEQKITLRAKALKSRASFSNAKVQRSSHKVLLHLEGLKIWQSRQAVHVYLPIKGKNEIDTWPVADWLLKNGHEVWSSYLPEDESKDGFCRLSLQTKYQTGRYGIPLPEESVSKKIDPTVIIVPCLAADERGNRLGYGSGWYDTFQRKHPNALRIGLVYNQFLLEDIPHTVKDQQLSIVVSEDIILHTSK